ncbi:alpha/beta hydrolase [Azonexus sp.]|uniref:alpha/beta hydrolase n=1 Tax=Azonexus sp. TaxID=1872668 RepID=UPI0027BA8082|nr:alpha/beta fold hydrolase [Azonexus sp.]
MFASLAILLCVALFALNLLIRRGLAAPRIAGEATPEELPWHVVSIPTVRQKKLFGWFIPSLPGAPCLVILHGWGSNAEMMLPLARPLHAAGYGLLFFEARNHGRSDGDDFSSLPRFAEDIECAIAWLRLQAEVDPLRIGLIGHSVGAGAALLVASRCQDIRAVISLSAFSHPASMMRRWLSAKGIPFWPLGAYILAYVQHVIAHRFEEIAPRNTIKRVSCPTLLVHAEDDRTVPVEDAREIHANRTGEQVRLLIVPGDHEQFDDLEQRITDLLDFLRYSMQ